jgi:hypothetical protein
MGTDRSSPAWIALVDPIRAGAAFKNAVRARGFGVVGVYTLDPPALERFAPAHKDGDTVSVHGGDAQQLARDMLRQTGGARPAAVIACTEPAVQIADELADALGVAGNPARSAAARRDKFAMRLHGSSRVSTPDWRAVTLLQAVPAAAAELGYPVIVKATSGAGAHNVILLESPHDLGKLSAADPYDLFGRRVRWWLVERYVRGVEYAVNTLSVAGTHRVLDTWRKERPDDADYDQPYWAMHQLPPNSATGGMLARFAFDVLDVYEVGVGACHIEIKVEDGIPWLIELGARLPGAHIPELWKRCCDGFDPYDAVVDAYLGRPTRERPYAGDLLGICFLPNAGPPSVLRRVAGLSAARQLSGVIDVSCPVAPGEVVETTVGLDSIPVSAWLRQTTVEAFDRTCDHIRTLITLETNDGSAQPWLSDANEVRPTVPDLQLAASGTG